MSITIFGMPQRTFMYSQPEGNNSVEIAADPYPRTYIESREIQRKPSYNFAFGFLLNHSFTKNIMIGYGMQYAPQEQQYHTSFQDNGYIIDNAVRLKYIKLSLFLQSNYIVREKYLLFITVGPQLNMLIGENGSLPVFRYFPDLKKENFFLIDPGGVYNNFVLGGLITTGGEFELDNRTSVFVRTYFDSSITSVEKKSFEDTTFQDSYKIFQYPSVTIKSKYNIAIGISLGLTFKIRGG